MEILAKPQKIEAKIDALFKSDGKEFQTLPCDQLELDFAGLKHDRHSGLTRKSGGREPWYARGTEIRNERQLSIVAEDELQLAAHDMNIDQIKPEWIGANMVLSGVERLSMLPASSLMFFEHGVTLKVDFQNKPCSYAGRSIADHYPDHNYKELSLAFPKCAHQRRGLVVWVEKPGTICLGEQVTIKIPEQWIYRA